ncbi:MAG: DUF1972 domain-containing protein [Pedobacter sp.]|nr:MAG: DUF1972 domain-containing protein [Pedobacter sp.]
MKIVIVGTRGIPDFYRGFEKGAQFLARGLADKGHEVSVYCAHNHSYQKTEWQGIKLIHIHDPEYRIGSFSSFFYDYFCFRDLKNRTCDIVIQYGPSSGIWSWMLPKNVILVSNISAIEWKLKKYNTLTSKFLGLAEKLAVRYSHSIISDSSLSCAYLRDRYKKRVKFIPCGVETVGVKCQVGLDQQSLKSHRYSLYIGSLEKHNRIEMILDGFVMSSSSQRFIVVGDHSTPIGRYLKEKYSHCPRIEFIGSIYDKNRLDCLRYFSEIVYYGRDEPTYLLYEAMAASCLLSVFESSANQYVLGRDALYFTNSAQVAKQLESVIAKKSKYSMLIDSNSKKTVEIYNWSVVIDQHINHLNYLISSRNAHSSVTNQLEARIITVK